ncbi:MAG: alkaline phosphatase, partial [Gammaproteobacteria bacterium]|nr:alkaline phosphatase [Gammaproteobacteria bacterium]
MRHILLLTVVLATTCASIPTPVASRESPQAPPVPQIKRPDGESAAWWFHAGAEAAARNRGADKPAARNVIIFIGDGMSIPTLAAARILEGQRLGASGEERRLSFEEFPHTALSRTYNTDSQTPDSAGTMSAITTGAKTRMGFISVGQAAQRGDCASAQGQSLVTLMELAETAGMATGIVTTTRLTHATPAATFAHAPDRNWESDGQIPAAQREHGCIDIARQLIE